MFKSASMTEDATGINNQIHVNDRKSPKKSKKNTTENWLKFAPLTTSLRLVKQPERQKYV